MCYGSIFFQKEDPSLWLLGSKRLLETSYPFNTEIMPSQAWRCMPMVPACGRLRQENRGSQKSTLSVETWFPFGFPEVGRVASQPALAVSLSPSV